LPTIEEGPDPLDPRALQDHIGSQWRTVVTAVEALKAVAGRNNKYELELDALGSDIDSLRAALSRLTNLVGSPVDGLSFDLYAIIDRNEDAVMELDHRVTSRVEPKLSELEAEVLSNKTELNQFRASTGDQLLARLAGLENSVNSMEASATPEALRASYSRYGRRWFLRFSQQFATFGHSSSSLRRVIATLVTLVGTMMLEESNPLT
jgi:hypothetical protein